MSVLTRRTPSARRAEAAWAPLVVAALATAGCGLAGGAQEGAVDQQTAQAEKLEAVQTGWSVYHGQTADELDQLLASTGARIISLQVESTSPLRFTAVMVQDAGVDSRRAWWSPDETEASLDARLSERGARLTSLHPYVVDGVPHFAVSMIENAGADRKQWWWYHGDWSFVAEQQRAHGARPVDLRQYELGGVKKYAMLMVAAGDGIDGAPYLDVTRDRIAALVAGGAGYLAAIEPADAAGDTFNVIVNRGDPGSEWWYWDGASWDGVMTTVTQNGHRLVDAKSYFVNGQRRCVAVAVDDTSGDAAEVRRILRKDLLEPVGGEGAAGGRFGFYLRSIAAGSGEAGDVVEEHLGERVQLDPASALKILIAARVMRAAELNAAARSGWTLDTPVEHAVPASASGSCPEPRATDAVVTDSVQGLLQKMLVDSDNWATRTLLDRFAGGFAGVNETATLVGMTSTRFAGYIGCYPFVNTTTLEDLALLYRRIEDLSIMSGASRERLFASMPADAWDPGWTLGRARLIVDDEAAKLGLPAALTRRFKDALKLHYKGGAYTAVFGASSAETRTVAGIADVPHCSGLDSRTFHLDSFAWGVYVEGARRIVIGGTAEHPYTQADRAADDANAEPLRKPIRERLASWSRCGF